MGDIATSVGVGDTLPELRLPRVDRATLREFGTASGDVNPIHMDAEAARATGLPDVVAHGMLGMAWLGRLLTGWPAASRLRKFNVRFMAITHLGNEPVLRGEVVELLEEGGERLARVRVEMRDQHDELKIQGEALVALRDA